MPDIQFSLDRSGYDALDETQRGYYEEHDGGYRLMQDPSLKSALDKQKAEIDGYKQQLESYPSADQIAAWRKRDEDTKQRKMAEETDNAKLRELHAADMAAEKKRYDDLLAQYQAKDIDSELGAALHDAGVNADGRELLTSRIRSRLALEKGKVVVAAEDGSPSFDSVGKLVDSYKTRFPALFQSDRTGGSGVSTKPNGATDNSYTREQLEQMPIADKARLLRESRSGKVNIVN